MCYHEECIRPFDPWSHLPLTVVTEAFLSATSLATATAGPHQHQVQVNLRLSTGKDQVLVNLHSVAQIRVLAGTLSEVIASLDRIHQAEPVEPVLIAKAVPASPIKT